MKCHAQTTDFFEIICQRVLAGCLFMREAPAIYLFTLRAFFEENPEIKEELRHNDRATFIHGIDDILIPADMDLIRPGIDIQRCWQLLIKNVWRLSRPYKKSRRGC